MRLMRLTRMLSLFSFLLSIWVSYAQETTPEVPTAGSQVASKVVPLYYFRDPDRLLRVLRSDIQYFDPNARATPTSPANGGEASCDSKATEGLTQHFDAIEALLKSRSERPFYFACANQAGRTAVERVAIAAFADSSSVFIIGDPGDVLTVENIISGYDRPIPQAKVGLWTIQLNVTQDDAKVRDLNRALMVIEEELADTRERSAMAGSILRDCLAEVVNETIVKNLSKYSGHPQAAKLASFEFYEPQITSHLGLRDSGDREHRDARRAFVLRNMPDPSRPTTLGEAMLILVMARKDTQRRVVDDWKGRVVQYIQKEDPEFLLTLSEPERKRFVNGDIFPVTRRAFSLDAYANDYNGITPIQAELLGALQRMAVINMIEEMRTRGLALSRKSNASDRAAYDVRIEFLSNEVFLDADRLEAIFASPEREPFNNLVRQFPIASVNARVAAADALLKKLIVAVEEDVDRLLVLPAIGRIQGHLSKHRINVGHFQRTNLLTSNRNESRIGTVTASELKIGDTMNLKALADFIAAAGANPLVALDNLTKAEADPRSQYNVAGGDVFVLTPIFDPSGQALRYDFRYTSKKPVGAVGDAEKLPEFSEYSLSTEVQLSTFELRTIASFVQNTEVRIPERRSGGIPVLNQIPVLREIPVIGWFSRRSGRSGVSHHSLVIGQTTIYPTIGDMLGLLLPPSSKIDDGGG